MANLNFNKVIIAGRIAKEPELKQTKTGKSVTSIPIAIKTVNNNTIYIVCEAWNKNAENIVKYFKKGSSILVEGSLLTETYTNTKAPQNVTVYKVNIESFKFVDSKNEMFEEIPDSTDLPL